MASKSEAYLPLMVDDLESSATELDSGSYDERSCQCKRSSLRIGRLTVPKDVLLHVVVFVQAVGFILLFLSYRQSTQAYEQLLKTGRPTNGKTNLHLYSPANDILEDEIRVFTDGFIQKTIYQEYSDESDKAWEDLYNRTIIKIPKSEAALLPNRTWPIKESPGYYIAELDVFHQLHCVNKLRQALRRDRYDQLLDHPEDEFADDHVSHCVESLRQYVMCHADQSVMVWQWDPKALKVKPRLEYPHMCKNFDKVRAWAEERHIDKYIDVKAYLEDDLPDPVVIY